MIILAIIFYVLLGWLRPCLALGVLVFLVPFGHLIRFSIGGVPFTFPEAAVYALAVVAMAHRVLRHCERAKRARQSQPLTSEIASSPTSGGLLAMTTRRWLRDPWVILPLLWIIVGAVSAAYSPNPFRAWGIWKAYFVAPVVLFWTIRALRDRMDVARYVVVPFAVGALGVALIAIIQRWWPIGVPYPWSLPGSFRATSVFGYPNAVGLYLAPLVPLCIAWSLRGRSRSNLGHTGTTQRLPRSPDGHRGRSQ